MYGKHSDCCVKVRTEQKTKFQRISRMDRTNSSIRVLLYSHNQDQNPKSEALSKFRVDHVCMHLDCSCCKRIFFQFLYLIQRKAFVQKAETCVKFLSSILFVYKSRPSISRSNTALEGLLINQSDGVFLSD